MRFHDASPRGAGLIQGDLHDRPGRLGQRRARDGLHAAGRGGAFVAVDHGLTLPSASSLHSIFVDARAASGPRAATSSRPALDDGMLVHYGDPRAAGRDRGRRRRRPDAGAPAACPAAIVAAGKSGSIARRWDEQALAAIRRDLPRPPFTRGTSFTCRRRCGTPGRATTPGRAGSSSGSATRPTTSTQARRAAISYAAYGVLTHRYQPAVGGPRTLACLRAVMDDLGYDPDDAHDTGDDPSPSGTASAHTVIAKTAGDGANEADDYADSAGYSGAQPSPCLRWPRARR